MCLLVRDLIVGTCECGLIWKKITDTHSDRYWQYWVEMTLRLHREVLNPIRSVLIGARTEDTGLCVDCGSHKARNARGHKKWQEVRNDSPPEPSKEHGSANTLIFTSGLQNY